MTILIWINFYLFSAFGKEEVLQLTEHFQTVLQQAGTTTDDLPSEWRVLKRTIRKLKGWKTLTWGQVCGHLKLQCPNILQLFDLLATIPVASAECERAFSQLNLIKTDFRASLSKESLNDIMTIRMAPSTIEDFDPHPAMEMWLAAKRRHLRYPSDRKRPGEADVEIEERAVIEIVI